jgi:putative ABC transport system ATP-binding protein
VRALRGVDLDVAAGELVALTGPSGCGKSTLLHVAAGLDRPDEGSVVLAGHELTSLTEDQRARVRRRAVGMVFQFFHLLDGMSALDNVALAAMAAGVSRRAAEERARDLLDLLGLMAKARRATRSAVRRAAAAAGRSPGRWPTAGAAAGRRADRRTGLEGCGGRAGPALSAARRRQAVLLVTHDPVRGGARRPGRAPAGRAGGVRRGRRPGRTRRRRAVPEQGPGGALRWTVALPSAPWSRGARGAHRPAGAGRRCGGLVARWPWRSPSPSSSSAGCRTGGRRTWSCPALLGGAAGALVVVPLQRRAVAARAGS